MQGAPVDIVVGSKVWIEDQPVSYTDGKVSSIDGQKVEIQTVDGRKVVSSLSKVYLQDDDTPECGFDDMTKLSYFHEPGILHNLSRRYHLKSFYTYTGSILIAINPFQKLPDLYDVHTMEQYKGASRGEFSPHVFAIADIAFRAMINEGKSNSILVSGESGAGKTETTKMLMRYLAYLGGRKGTGGRNVEQQVLESNPVLEAFGNAKTVRNNNSSRFGKFIELQFDNYGRISGAAIRTYLLERSRVCQVSDPERNYHCFYLLCEAPEEEIKRYKLGSPKSFRYLNQSNCYKLVGVSDAQDYLATRRAMDIVGISEKEQEAIFRVVAAILHLGNIEFARNGDTDSSVLKDEKSKFHLQTTSELLMCDVNVLEDVLLTRSLAIPEDVIKKCLDPENAAVSRDALAKTIYSRLFDWLVEKINNSIGQDPKSKSLIGILDIYGFESFESNSFEQFCINYTNEKLQQHFNQHVFKLEQEEYNKEGIDWSYIEFVDNRDVLDLIEKKPGGIIALLDEACMFPKSTHESFSQKLYQTFSGHKNFIKPKLARSEFSIAHYAGEVLYQSDQFLDKNKDYIVPEHQGLLCSSKCPFVAGLLPPLCEETSKLSKFSSIGSRFKLQLQQLMDVLNSTEPHYIRCMKPNNLLKPSIFENATILHQLRCSGVIEAVRISCAGYPMRKTFSEFLKRFGILAPEVLVGTYEEKDACKMIFEKMRLPCSQIGKTKVFLRAGEMGQLEAMRTHKLSIAAKRIQRNIKSRIERKYFLDLQKAAICIQSSCRATLACKLCENIRREASSLRIQRSLRGHFARKSYRKLKSAVIILQKRTRTLAAFKNCRRKYQNKFATIIQAHWRGYRAFLYYKRLIRASIVTQCCWRGRIARKELERLMTYSGDAEGQKISVPVEDAEKINDLTAEVERLKILLQSEKQRADDCERKCAEALESSEEKRLKLEESERRVHRLQESLNRMLCSISDQFSELKVILSASSSSSSTSRLISRYHHDDATTSSDAASTFPAPASTSENLSLPPDPASFQLIVQDLSAAEIAGYENWESDREGAFDDFF
ncbi:unnamed protein product [Cuscuta europaea]|uniref:Uncharacterized protein n=1 Tax=Cuscuta europaea TaxID=41803 RepID=A0A9P0YSJ3_CUSEU|nr:unnamed protein product [Cuscuta europaea]